METRSGFALPAPFFELRRDKPGYAVTCLFVPVARTNTKKPAPKGGLEVS